MSRFYALLLLAWHLVIHLIQKLTFVYDPGGLELFRENFDRDGLYSLTARERELLSDWQRCIGCGLCEAACPALSIIPKNRHAGPRYLAMGSMRDLSESGVALDSAESLEACDGDELEEVCPVDIPLGDLAEFIKRVGRAEREMKEGSAEGDSA